MDVDSVKNGKYNLIGVGNAVDFDEEIFRYACMSDEKVNRSL